MGSNGAPEKFDLFMTGLHNHWGLPVAELDGQKGFLWKSEIKGSIVEEFDTLETRGRGGDRRNPVKMDFPVDIPIVT